MRYDDIGQMQTSTFVDYHLPSAAEAPRFVLDHLPVADAARWDRVKGVGEAGMVGRPAAIVNAVYDAAGAQGQNLRQVPLTPRRVYELLHPADRAG